MMVSETASVSVERSLCCVVLVVKFRVTLMVLWRLAAPTSLVAKISLQYIFSGFI